MRGLAHLENAITVNITITQKLKGFIHFYVKASLVFFGVSKLQ